MPAPDAPTPSNPETQRHELESSERAASAGQPKNFRDEAIDEKIVGVDPIANDDSAIKGLDPK